jgi:hypothetical protein
VQLALPDTITQEEAVSLNTTAQHFDGIEQIDHDGRFTLQCATWRSSKKCLAIPANL